MTLLAYKFEFDEIGTKPSLVKIIELAQGQEIAVDSRVMVNDDQLFSINHSKLPRRNADLVDLAIAVYTADRLTPRCPTHSRRIHVCLPIRNLMCFNRLHKTCKIYFGGLHVITGRSSFKLAVRWDGHLNFRCGFHLHSKSRINL